MPNSTAFASSRWIDAAVEGFGQGSLPFRALLDAPSRAPSGNQGSEPQQTAPLSAALTFTPQPLPVLDNSRSQVFCYGWHKWTRAAGIRLFAPLFFKSYMGFSAVHFTHTHTHTVKPARNLSLGSMSKVYRRQSSTPRSCKSAKEPLWPNLSNFQRPWETGNRCTPLCPLVPLWQLSQPGTNQ